MHSDAAATVGDAENSVPRTREAAAGKLDLRQPPRRMLQGLRAWRLAWERPATGALLAAERAVDALAGGARGDDGEPFGPRHRLSAGKDANHVARPKRVVQPHRARGEHPLACVALDDRAT